MSLLDRFRENIDQVKEGGQKIKDLATTKLEATQLQNKEADLLIELGQRVYDLHRKGQLRHIEIKELCNAIEKCRAEAAEKQHAIDEFLDLEGMRIRNEDAAAERLQQLADRDVHEEFKEDPK